MRLTGIAIDPAGNVWVPNNWKRVPDLANPGGDGMIVFVGVAAPVKTPLIGPVRSALYIYDIKPVASCISGHTVGDL
jgi:hypothetical protein